MVDGVGGKRLLIVREKASSYMISFIIFCCHNDQTWCDLDNRGGITTNSLPSYFFAEEAAFQLVMYMQPMLTTQKWIKKIVGT